MKAARYLGPGRLSIEDVDPPTIGEGEVLVRMHACGVCGTDVKTYVRGHALIQPGSVLGHEIAGTVSATRHHGFEVGQRVAVGPYAPCNACEACARGHPSLCANLGADFAEPGGFAEWIRVPRRLADQVMFVLPDEMSFETASLTEPLACCVHGLRVAGFRPGASVLIIGDGPMGLLQAGLARAWGAGSIMVSGLTPNRLEFARGIADVVVDASQEDLAAAVRRWQPDGAETTLVSVASVDALEQAIALAVKGGAVNVFAGMPKDQTLGLDLRRVHYDEVRVVGSFGYGPADFRDAFDLLSEGRMPLEGFITDRVAIADVESALRAAANHQGIKTVVVA